MVVCGLMPERASLQSEAEGQALADLQHFPEAGNPLSDDDDDEEEPDSPTEEMSHEAVPPLLRQVPEQPQRRKKANRVSICTAKSRSSRMALEVALARLHWEQVSRDTPEVSVSWLEHTDSTAAVSPFQVMSKIEGMLQVCRKADLAACLQAMQKRFPNDYNFFPRTWILSCLLPDQVADLEKAMNEKKGWTYICKPTSGSQGRGVRMVKTFAELKGPVRDAFPKGSERLRPAEYVVQRYVTKPLLVDGYKFDCRVYVIVTSVVPLQAYLFEEGLARFCTTKYEKPRGRNLGNMCMHLTNYAVNKHSDAFDLVNAHDLGSKRSLSSVFALIEAEGGPSRQTLWDEIRSVTEKTLLALRPALVDFMSHGEHGAFHPAGPKGFHILGFDILFDERYRPILIELNANSSMSVLQPCAEPGETRGSGTPPPDQGSGTSPSAKTDAKTEASELNRRTEVSELDLTVKAELITQALLVVNPLRHRLALQGRIAWFQATHSSNGANRLPMAVAPPVDEPIPLDDDGQPVHETAMVMSPRPDRPDKCPALRPMEFQRHAAYCHVQNHLQAYRVWRHYSFNPPGSCALSDGQPHRRYLGFGRPQFRQFCDAAGLIAVHSPSSRSSERVSQIFNPIWHDRTTAELFWSRCGAAENLAGSALDFPRFVRHMVFPIGEALKENLGDLGQEIGDPVEVFVAHMLASASQSMGMASPRHYFSSEHERDSFRD